MTELNILSAELPHCNPVMPDRIFMIIICSVYLSLPLTQYYVQLQTLPVPLLAAYEGHLEYMYYLYVTVEI